MKHAFKVSIVIPTYNEEESVPVLFEAIQTELKDFDFETIFVNDGSRDGSLEVIKRLSLQHKAVRYLSFSRNFGHQAALRAGIDHAFGDCVISMDADMQHSPTMLKQLITVWQEGYDIVYTRRQDTANTSFFKRFTSKLFYDLVNKLSGLAIEYGAADFRLIDKKVAKVIRGLPKNDLFMRGFIAWCGFKQHAIDYVPAERFAGKSKYSLKKMMALAAQGITQFSIKPLRFATILGFLSALSGLAYGLYALVAYFFTTNVISGWTSVVVCILIIGGVQLIILGIIGEYLGRTFLQTTQLPNYIVAEQLLGENK